MSIVDFLSDLRRAGIHISLNEDKLKIKAPSGALTNEIKIELKHRKEEIIAFLQESSKVVDTSSIPVIDRNGQLPLSFSQQGLWFIDQMHPGSVAYNMPFAVKLVGDINLPALSAAVSEIIRRHESLRTRFLQTEDGVPYVVIDPARDYSIEQAETAVTGDLKDALLALAGEEAKRPFILNEGALFRFKLIHVQHPQGDVNLLLGSIHHIISDGWSMSVLLREIAVLYAVNLQGLPSPLPPLPIQYPDFAAWQRDFLQGENLEEQLGYWRDQLEGMPSLLALPTDRIRPAEQTSNGSKYEFKLDDQIVSALDAHCKTLGITLFTGLMAAWQLLLSKYAQQELFCVGIPMAGRSRKETENLIGFFVNALLVKADLRNNPTVAEFVDRVKNVVLGAFSHQDVPLQLILDDLNVPRSLAHQPLAQVGFQLQNFSGQGATDQEAAMIEQVAAATNLKMEPVVSDEAASKYDMILTLVQNNGSLAGNVEFNTDLFDRETIAKMIQHFERTMKIVVEEPDMPVSRIAIASPQEIREAIGVNEEEGELLPLCNAQLELLLDAQVNPTSIQNAIGYWIVINSELDLNVFKQAVDHVCQHTRILDARFYTCDLPYADPGYQVHPNQPRSHFEYDDFTDRQLNGESPELLADVDGWIYRARDVFAGGLYITRLIKLSETEYVLAAYSHHLVSDGLSLTSHVKRLAKAYQCLCQGEKLPNWKNLYADHIEQDRLELDRAPVTDYWRKTLENVEPLNFSLPIETKPAEDFVILREDLTEAETALIRNYCADNKVHPSELFRLITAYLVKTYCRPENDFVLLEIQGGRNRRNYDQIGVYYQQVPFVVNGDLLLGNTAIDDFYHYAKDTLDQLKPYRYISMAKQRELIGQGRLSFQYNYYNFIREVAFAESNTTPSYCSPRPEGVAQIVIRDEACFSITLMFETEIFANQGFVERMKTLALKVAQGEARTIQQLDLLSSQERTQLSAWNQTQRSLPRYDTIIDWFEAQVSATPDNIAVIFGESQLSYNELNEQANQLANYLRSKGVSPKDRVAISIDRSLDMVVAVWGVLKAGCTYIPVDVNYPKERLAFLIEDSRARALITESCMLDRLPETDAVRVLIDDERAQIQTQSTCLSLDYKMSGQDLIYIIYTSGSTGKPKGAAVRHHGEVNLLSWYTQDLNLTEADKALVISVFGFDLTQKNLFALLMVGGTLVIPQMHQYDDSIVLQSIQQHQITLLNCAPSAFYPLVDAVENNRLDDDRAQLLASMRYLILGGEPIRLSALYPWFSHAACQCQLVNSYGPTECTDVVAYHVLDQIAPNQTLIPIGKPINNTQLYIVDDELKQIPIGLVGELCIAGDGVGAGYIGRDDLTTEVFIENPFGEGKLYKTGDLARYLPDGSIEYIGRKDFQIKLRGLRIELGEIEHALRQLQGVSDGLALVLNEQLVAYVVVDNTFDKNSWRNGLADYLPDYMIPAHVVPLQGWPLTPNGKVDRRALPAPDQRSRRVEFVAPRTDVEKILAQIWSHVLKVEEVGIYDNFFDLGGHSLLATQVASRARKAFNSNIQLRDLLGEPTIASIALQVEKLIRAGGERVAAIEAVSREQRLPLSFAQQRLWLLDKIEPGSVAYNVPLAVEIRGSLDVSALQQAFNSLVARHEVLRTSFTQDDEGACLAIEPEGEFSLSVVDVMASSDETLSTEELETEVRRLVAIEVMTPFRLDKAPLLRAKLFQVGEQRYVLSVVLHHIITDGWSMGVLIKELGALYVAEINQAASPLNPLALQYADYAYWQRSQISEDVLASHLDFWRAQLNGVPALNLPIDFPRPAVQTYKGSSIHFSLPEETKRQFKNIARQQNTTLFNVLLAAYGAFLYRYTGQEDFAIGSPVAGRDDAELEALVGFFVNTLVVRQNFAGIKHFNQLVNTISSRVLDCEAHQQIPFEQIVEVVDPIRDMSRSPVFQTMLVYQNLPVDSESLENTETQLGDIRFSPLGLDVETAKFELMMTIAEGAEAQPFQCQLQYNTDLFANKTAEKIAEHFALFCQGLATKPEQPLYSHQMLSEAEISTQLIHWNQTQVDYDKSTTVQQQFAASVSRFPDFTAVKCGPQFLSYQQLNNVANAIALRLMAEGVKPDDKVGLCFNRHIALMPAILGILKAGATYVPLDASYPEGRIRYIVDDAAIPLVVTTNEIASRLDFEGIEFLGVDDLLQQVDTAIEDVITQPDAERLLYMIYTSGSTGRPKGTGAYQRSEINLLNWYCRQFNMTPQDRLLLMSAIGFDLTQKNLFAPLMSGATLVIPEFQEFDPALLIPLIQREQISWINCAPSAFYPLQDDSDHWDALGSLRYLFLGGEPINLARLAHWLEQSNCQLINSYGPTECTDISNWHRIDLNEERKHAVLAIGRPNDNVRLYILGSHQELLPVGAVGELCIGGDSVGPGYLNNQLLTEQVFIQNPFSERQDTIYRTGDMARYREDGTVEYLGRRDQQVKLRGFRIETGEIQGVINEHRDVVDSLVSVVKTESSEQLVIWIITEVPASDYESLIESLRSHAAHYLPSHMIPGAWQCLAEFPLTPNGKIDRKALPQPSFNDDRPVIEPRTELEKSIAHAWCAVLGVDKVSVDQNFFQLGGHSLLATKVVARLSNELNQEIPVRLLFEANTVEQFAERLFALRSTSGATQKPPVQALGLVDDIPLTLAQQRLWLFEQLNPGTATNNMPAAVRLKGRFNIKAVRRAVSELVRRHDALRTHFYLNESEQPRQRVLSQQSNTADISVTDLRSDADANSKAILLAGQDRSKPFDLLTGPLFRTAMLQLADDEYVLMINMHHIISDGVSVNVILRELMTLYYAFDHNIPSPLPELSLQYSDYAVWQQTYLQGGVLEEQLNYWDRQLAKAPVLSTFPTDNPRPAIQTTNGKSHHFQFDPVFAKQLQHFCQQQGITPFMFMFAVWSLLLSRYSRQQDLCIGIPTAGRHQPELENIIGFFINSMVLRVDFSGNPSAQEHLERVKNVVLNGFAHGDVPIETIVERLALERNPAFTPLVQTAFQLLVDEKTLDAGEISEHFTDLDVEVIATEGVSAKFDMLLTLNQGDDYLLGSLEYNTDLYREATIEKISKQYIALAKAVMADASHSYRQYPLYQDSEIFSYLGLDAQQYEQLMPLTTTQEAFLWHLQIHPETEQYCVGFAYDIRRPLNEEIFKQALQFVTNEFSALRAEFHLNDLPGAAMAYQAVRKNKAVIFDVEDVSDQVGHLPVEERQLALKPTYEALAYHSYNVEKDPLIVFRLLKTAQDH
ncbi:MAG: amino acid adenylation domain-containing protein, partial [Pseudomonadales bacterium]|nr:amino acid adenylation domain-containing protein [Pseudomonadales bacterium]